MVVIAGYEVLTQLHMSSRSVVYRAERELDRVPVILKATQSEYPSLEELARFRLEYEILNRLSAVDGISRVYGLEPHQSGVVLVLEDFGGESLQRRLLRQRLDPVEGLSVAIALTEILGQVHAANVIHKDINPANVVYDAETGRVGLIDFGNATVLSRENPTLQTPNRLEGTLAYLSPEQTGRMNRSLDYRTDFYSLGATLYELLTGAPPFAASDPMELIHCHLAKQPDPPHEVNPAVPSVLSQIVLKLLAKNAEDRYQSAYGLKTDLERCLVDLRATGAIAPFPLGQDDASGRFQIPQKLYGRDREVQLLLEGFERVAAGQAVANGRERELEFATPSKLPALRAAMTAAGRSEMMLVAGYSGIGKSSLVQEIYKPITRHKGYFIAGKYDQFQRNIPYSALIQAFQELMQQLLTESQTQIDRWKTLLSKALGRNGQVVIEVIPEVELIIGPQPPVPLLAPDATQNRFNLVFQNFIRVFTQAEHALVMFLDDLQWADVASLKLIERLLIAPDSRYLFLVGAYRSNEVSPAHPLMLTLEQIRQEGVRISQIDLAPLDADTVQQIVADTCCVAPQAIAPLANYVMQITEGNPFFLTEFLKSLYAEGLLNYDASSGNWQWDLSQIRDTGLPEDVVELMADKIQKLEPDTQRVLRLAACLGNQFDVPTLAIVSDLPQSAVATDLWQSVQEGLVMPLGGGYPFASLEQNGQESSSADELQSDPAWNRDLVFRFLHDRVQQAAYSLIPETERETIHYRIGRSLLTHSSADQQEEHLFDIVNHLNTGIGLITNPVERHELARLNLKAGTKAKESNAYDTALRYLRVGADLLDQHSWQNQYELTLALHEEAAEAAYLKGDFDLVNQLADLILHHARAHLDTVKAYQTQISTYSAQNNMDAALDVFVTAANRLGLKIPRHPSRLQVGLELMRTRFWVIGNRSSRDLEALPPMTDPVKEGIMRLVSSPIMAAANAAPYLIAVTALRVINLVVKYGSSPQTAAQGVAYGVMLRAGLGDIDRAYDFGQMSLRLLERLNARQFKTIVIVGYETCLRHWKEPLRRSPPELLAAYAEGLELGNQEAASLAASVYCFHQMLLGEPLYEVAEAFQQYETQLLSFGQEQVLYSMLPWHQLVLHLRGQGIEGDSGTDRYANRLVGSIYNEDEMMPQFIDRQLGVPLFYGSIAKVIWAYHIGDYATAIKTGKQAVVYQESSPMTSLYALFYFYWPLAYLAHYNSVSPKVQRQYLRQINKFLRMTKRWATYCPANYLHRHLLLEAERLRVLGHTAEAIDAYDQAIQAAKDNNFINDLALAQELAGKFYLALGKERLAQSYLIDARYTYLRWGATYKVDALNTLYPQLLDRRMEASSRANLLNQTVSLGSSNSTGGSQGLNLDLDTVIKAAQAISGEIVLANLLEKLLKLAIENAGAQKGCLLLLQGDELRIEAEGQLEEEQLVRVQSRSPDEQTLPLSLIYYVQRTREDVVLRDAVEEGLFTTDPYIVQHQLRSVLCSPIINQGNLIGLLYLENNLATDTFTPERVTVLNILSAQAAIALENAQFYRTLEQKVEERTAQLARANDEITLLNQQLQSENLRMGAELAITRQIQQMMLPKDHELEQIEALEIAGFMEPADEVGGDYYDVLYDKGAVKIGIGDITGHGLESGMLMLMVQTAVRTLLSTQETDSVRFLSTLNRVIYDNVQRMNCDRSLSLALLDYEAGQLRLSGQHEEVLVVRANGDIESINTMELGFPVGLVEDISDFITHTHIHLQPGDGVVLYTDGITEAANETHELYGIERLCQVICQHWQSAATDIRQAVITDVRRHIGRQKVFDDITLLIVKQR